MFFELMKIKPDNTVIEFIPLQAERSEISLSGASPLKDASCVPACGGTGSMTTAGEREKLIMVEMKPDGYQASRFEWVAQQAPRLFNL